MELWAQQCRYLDVVERLRSIVSRLCQDDIVVISGYLLSCRKYFRRARQVGLGLRINARRGLRLLFTSWPPGGRSGLICGVEARSWRRCVVVVACRYRAAEDLQVAVSSVGRRSVEMSVRALVQSGILG